jgi:hypothetical protein
MKRKFEYVIKVNGKEVWKGLNPTKAYFEIKKKYPKKEVSIAWRTKEKVLVCSWSKLIACLHNLKIKIGEKNLLLCSFS